MAKQEKSFQNYFTKLAKPLNYHRTSLSNGSGFPDITGFHGDRHSLVELKDLVLGKRGDRLLKQDFEPSQPPWYADYLKKGGTRLFVAFRIREWDESGKRYGLLKMTTPVLMKLINNELKYTDLNCDDTYHEYVHCKDMIEEIENVP